jgi:RND superfamily putative drug exporter
MFSRWGAFVYRHRRIILILAVALGAAAASVAGKSTDVLTAGGWLDPKSESNTVQQRLASEFGQGESSLVLVFMGPVGADAKSPAFQAQVAASVKDLRADPDVAQIVGYAETGLTTFITNDGTGCYVVAELNVTDEESVPLLDRFVAETKQPGDGITMSMSGYAPFTRDTASQSEIDLRQAESISLPLAAIVLILVFGSLVASAMPLLVAGLAIPTTLALVWLVGQQVQLSIFVQNISTMLGLSLAIDYSLFMTSRFREELRKGRSVGDAVTIAVATSGKAVAFSGIAVTAGLSGLLAFDAPALRSFGIGGMLTVFASLFFALTFLPALLGMLGPRVSALSPAGLIARIRRGDASPDATADPSLTTSRWARIAERVMAHPVAVLVPTLVILLAAGIPFLHLEQGLPGSATLPKGLESREAAVALETRFQTGTTTPMIILVDVPGDPASAANITSVLNYQAKLAATEGITAVSGPFSGLVNPATGATLTAEQMIGLYGQPKSAWPPSVAALWKNDVAGSTVKLTVISSVRADSPAGAKQIPGIRALSSGTGLKTQIGGYAAVSHDFLQAQSDRIPVAIGTVILAMAIILFLLFGSVVLPVKAILMTLLSLSASFGALVWIFQDGHFSDALNFTTPGFTMAGIPIIMFCVLVGLSMDYEVLLLSRVQEAWRRTGDNRASVAEGLAKTAGVITGAAAIMISVFAAFSLASTLTIKSMGVGMAVAVFVDATIIRVLLVPATMRLLGRWNWWAPGPLKHLADRVGFDHAEVDETEAASNGTGGMS